MPSLSQLSLELDGATSLGLMPYIEAASRRWGVPLPVLLAVASRESGIGRNLPPSGTGDNGWAWGVMQIHTRWHGPETGFVATGPFDHAAVIDYGARLLRQGFDRHGNWFAAAAAYNAGPDCADDSCTTGGNYASDVISRASTFERILAGDTFEQLPMPVSTPLRPPLELVDEPTVQLPDFELDLPRPLSAGLLGELPWWVYLIAIGSGLILWRYYE